MCIRDSDRPHPAPQAQQSENGPRPELKDATPAINTEPPGPNNETRSLVLATRCCCKQCHTESNTSAPQDDCCDA
eukprot:5245201-Alexandrium_andersonii.AAC.1